MKDIKEDEMTKILEDNRDHMIMDALLRITTLENLLIRKNILTSEEIKEEILVLSTAVAKAVTENIASTLGTADRAELEKWAEEFSVVNKIKDPSSN